MRLVLLAPDTFAWSCLCTWLERIFVESPARNFKVFLCFCRDVSVCVRQTQREPSSASPCGRHPYPRVLRGEEAFRTRMPVEFSSAPLCGHRRPAAQGVQLTLVLRLMRHVHVEDTNPLLQTVNFQPWKVITVCVRPQVDKAGCGRVSDGVAGVRSHVASWYCLQDGALKERGDRAFVAASRSRHERWLSPLRTRWAHHATSEQPHGREHLRSSILLLCGRVTVSGAWWL